MKTQSAALVLSACLVMSRGAAAQDALKIVSDHVRYTFDVSSPEAAKLMREVAEIIGAEAELKVRIETNASRTFVHDALVWAAARRVGFSQQAFTATFPNLFKYAHALIVSADLYKSPRLIYQLKAATGEPEPRMLFGDGETPTIATMEKVKKWNDKEGVTDWIGEFSFEKTDQGPYLVSTSIGRETTGVASIRHVLGWVRVEATRLVPERFEAFDVPIGQKRQPAHLKITALPEVDAALPLPESTSRSHASHPQSEIEPLANKISPIPEALESGRTTPNEAPTSSTPRLIIVVWIVAATTLLWFLVKRRS